MTPLAAIRRVAVALALSLAWMVPALAAPTFPKLTGRVVDDAHVLPASTVADLTRKLADLEARTGRQLVVVTLPSLQGYEVEDYGYQLGRAWGIGQKKLNNGVLFIVAPNERRVRIEVGYGLEPILTDALSSAILNARVLPKFRAGDIAGGIVAGTDAIVEQLLLDAPAAKARVAAAEREQTQPRSHGFDPVVLLLIFAFFVLPFLLSLFRRRSYGRGLASALPWIVLGSGLGRGGWGGGSGWGGGGSWGGGGGGFSGGGGSFGGGGASGSW